MNQLEQAEEKNERLEIQLAEMRDENERLRAEMGNHTQKHNDDQLNTTINIKQQKMQEKFLKEEITNLRAEIKDYATSQKEYTS
jgi:hypothetical protein